LRSLVWAGFARSPLDNITCLFYLPAPSVRACWFDLDVWRMYGLCRWFYYSACRTVPFLFAVLLVYIAYYLDE
jgi:hypothetical protein